VLCGVCVGGVCVGGVCVGGVCVGGVYVGGICHDEVTRWCVCCVVYVLVVCMS